METTNLYVIAETGSFDSGRTTGKVLISDNVYSSYHEANEVSKIKGGEPISVKNGEKIVMKRDMLMLININSKQ